MASIEILVALTAGSQVAVARRGGRLSGDDCHLAVGGLWFQRRSGDAGWAVELDDRRSELWNCYGGSKPRRRAACWRSLRNRSRLARVYIPSIWRRSHKV
jgi:hypothetical protein